MRMFGFRLAQLMVELSAIVLAVGCAGYFWFGGNAEPVNLREAHNILFAILFVYFVIQLFFVAFADIGAQGRLVLDVILSLFPFLVCFVAFLEHQNGSLRLTNFQIDVMWQVMAVSAADVAANTAIRARLQQLIAIRGHSASN